MGSAKQDLPWAQMDMTKLPSESQFPIFPAMQAISLGAHGEEKLSVEKRALYSLAVARLLASSAGVRLVLVGGCEMMVGIWVMGVVGTVGNDEFDREVVNDNAARLVDVLEEGIVVVKFKDERLMVKIVDTEVAAGIGVIKLVLLSVNLE